MFGKVFEVFPGGLKSIVKASVSRTIVDKEVATAPTEYIPVSEIEPQWQAHSSRLATGSFNNGVSNIFPQPFSYGFLYSEKTWRMGSLHRFSTGFCFSLPFPSLSLMAYILKKSWGLWYLHRFSTAFSLSERFIAGYKAFYSRFNWFCFHKIWIHG